MLALHPGRLMSFSTELQDILGFKLCKGAGHVFAQDPRVELTRHYGALPAHDPYLEVRNALRRGGEEPGSTSGVTSTDRMRSVSTT